MFVKLKLLSLTLLPALLTLTPNVVRAETGSAPNGVTQLNPISIPIGYVEPGVLDFRDTKVNGYYLEAYRFSGTAGTQVKVRVAGSNDRRKSNNLSLRPYILLYGPDNQLITKTGAAPNTVDAYIRLKLRETGNYTVVFRGTTPNKPGRYWLSVQYIPVTEKLTDDLQISERPTETKAYSRPSSPTTSSVAPAKPLNADGTEAAQPSGY